MTAMARRTAVLLLAGLLMVPQAQAGQETPKSFKYAAWGVIVGGAALFVNKEADRWRTSSDDLRREGDRIFAAREDKYGLTYQERAAADWHNADGLRTHANDLKGVAIGLGVVSAAFFGVGVYFGARGVVVKKSFRFGGSHEEK